MSGIVISYLLDDSQHKEGGWVVHVNELFQISGLRVGVNTN